MADDVRKQVIINIDLEKSRTADHHFQAFRPQKPILRPIRFFELFRIIRCHKTFRPLKRFYAGRLIPEYLPHIFPYLISKPSVSGGYAVPYCFPIPIIIQILPIPTDAFYLLTHHCCHLLCAKIIMMRIIGREKIFLSPFFSQPQDKFHAKAVQIQHRHRQLSAQLQTRPGILLQ